MLAYRRHADTRAPRIGEILAGLGIGFFAVLLGAFAIFMVARTVARDEVELGAIVFISVATLLSLFCGVTAFRLFTGKGRKADGGLFPPWLLRVFGLIFVAGTALLAYSTFRYHKYSLGGILTSLTIACGCFYLAARQERVNQDLLARADT